MSKRPYEDDRQGGGGYNNYGHGNSGYGSGGHQQKKQKGQHFSPQNKQNQPQRQNQQQQKSSVSAPSPLPPLPPINTDAPFRHASTTDTRRSLATDDTSYEKLEFLGDAYLEIWASKLIHQRLHHLPAGRMSQVRELLVKNETLAVYARAYGFDQRLHAADMEGMQAHAAKGNKGFNKVMGDIFEAYVAAVCLADEKNGEATGQQWVTALWEPALSDLQATDPTMAQPSETNIGDPSKTFDPKAKELLQKRIGAKGVSLEYVTDKPSLELKGKSLGQNRHFIALYLTGHGYNKELLGKGEGRSKTEAGMWAATEAMYGDKKDIVAECEAKALEWKEKAKQEKAERAQSGQNDLLASLERKLLPTG